MDTWLLFTYKVPNEPSARRVYVWRKLKALGAIILHDSVWVLPPTARTREKLQWLASEIKEMQGGDAMLWESKQIFTGQEPGLVQQFVDQVDALYKDILKQLQTQEPRPGRALQAVPVGQCAGLLPVRIGQTGLRDTY